MELTFHRLIKINVSTIINFLLLHINFFKTPKPRNLNPMVYLGHKSMQKKTIQHCKIILDVYILYNNNNNILLYLLIGTCIVRVHCVLIFVAH